MSGGASQAHAQQHKCESLLKFNDASRNVYSEAVTAAVAAATADSPLFLLIVVTVEYRTRSDTECNRAREPVSCFRVLTLLTEDTVLKQISNVQEHRVADDGSREPKLVRR